MLAATVLRMGSTNYQDTFIAVAEDSAATVGLTPPESDDPSIASRTFSLISAHPYELTSDDVIFTVWADRKGLPQTDRPAAREAFFATGRACLRASDLGKRYGWGVHSDERGRVALYGVETEGYRDIAEGRRTRRDGRPVALKKAMRSHR